MAKFYARPVLANGLEAMGTHPIIDGKWEPGLLSGNYANIDNFVRNQIKKYSNGHRRWNVYVGDFNTTPEYTIILDTPGLIGGINGFRQMVWTSSEVSA
jgi:hypothetical protein